MIRAYRQGLTDAISTLNVEKKPTADAKQLNPDKVIEWLSQNIFTACYNEHDVVLSQHIEKFKKDFRL